MFVSLKGQGMYPEADSHLQLALPISQLAGRSLEQHSQGCDGGVSFSSSVGPVVVSQMFAGY